MKQQQGSVGRLHAPAFQLCPLRTDGRELTGSEDRPREDERQSVTAVWAAGLDPLRDQEITRFDVQAQFLPHLPARGFAGGLTRFHQATG